MNVIPTWLKFGRSIASQLGALERQLAAQTAMLKTLIEKADKAMSVYDDLLAQVSAITALKPAITTFINGQNAKMDELKAQIAQLEGSGAPDAATVAKLTAAVDELKGDATDIAASIMQGTPADAGSGASTPPTGTTTPAPSA